MNLKQTVRIGILVTCCIESYMNLRSNINFEVT
jgi:hypothetical protein